MKYTSWKPLNISIILGIIVLSMLLQGCNNPLNRSPASATPASWATQYLLAREAVLDVAPDAILFKGTATRIPDSGAAEGNLAIRVTLQFIRPSGETIAVEYEDREVTDTLKLLPTQGSFSPALSEQQREELSQAATTIQIAPSEALAKTLVEGQAFAKQYNADLDPLIGLHTDVQEVFGIPAAWSVQYFAPSKEIRIWVNPATGEILGRTDGALYPTAQLSE